MYCGTWVCLRRLKSGYASPGVGLDGVYRDPWGIPYFITVDLNSDEKCRDSFYRLSLVSKLNAQGAGYNGLISGPGLDNFLYNGQIMVWSAGPDKSVDPGVAANKGLNKDNVLSWK